MVLDMPAITFFTMLSEGHRVQAREQMQLALIALLPHIEEGARQQYLQQLEYAALDPEIDYVSDDYSGLEQAKQLFETID